MSGVSERMFGDKRGRSLVQKALNTVTGRQSVGIKAA